MSNQLLSHVWLFVTPLDRSPPSSSVHGTFSGKNTGAGCHVLLQGIFPTQGSNLYLFRLVHWQVDSWPLCHLGSSIPGMKMLYFLLELLEVQAHPSSSLPRPNISAWRPTFLATVSCWFTCSCEDSNLIGPHRTLSKSRSHWLNTKITWKAINIYVSFHSCP